MLLVSFLLEPGASFPEGEGRGQGTWAWIASGCQGKNLLLIEARQGREAVQGSQRQDYPSTSSP